MELFRFEDIDVLRFLGEVVTLHVKNYKEDLDLDADLIRVLVETGGTEDRRLLWLARPSGTWCLRERNVYLEGTHEHRTWKFYGEQTRDEILAFAIALKEKQGDRIIGTIHELDYEEHYMRVKMCALPVVSETYIFDGGTKCDGTQRAFAKTMRELTERYGEAPSFVLISHPESEMELDTVLRRERFKRDYNSVPGNADEYLRGLAERKVAQDKNPSVIQQIAEAKRESTQDDRPERAASIGKGQER
jgi:hypothetical protein